MTVLRLRAALLLVVALLAFGAAVPAVAAVSSREPAPIVREYDPWQGAENGGREVEEPLIWGVIGVAAACAVLGTLYFLKRELGGFPENPDWVAPISIVRSADAPVDETDFPEPPAGDHGH